MKCHVKIPKDLCKIQAFEKSLTSVLGVIHLDGNVRSKLHKRKKNPAI